MYINLKPNRHKRISFSKTTMSSLGFIGPPLNLALPSPNLIFCSGPPQLFWSEIFRSPPLKLGGGAAAITLPTKSVYFSWKTKKESVINIDMKSAINEPLILAWKANWWWQCISKEKRLHTWEYTMPQLVLSLNIANGVKNTMKQLQQLLITLFLISCILKAF